jgi:hypothetical protein
MSKTLQVIDQTALVSSTFDLLFFLGDIYVGVDSCSWLENGRTARLVLLPSACLLHHHP